uniref:CCHC-type domain-containing protein n=1 Tax=Erpetoichthys calabaricus TaxID=27687 RepID=A0A8C4SXU3_ERPCA
MLKKWCRGKGLSEAHGLLVIVPKDVEIAHIEETLGTIKCLGRLRVRGGIFNMELNSLMVLCECKNALTAESVPPEVHLPEGGEAWSLVIIDRAPATDENFNTKLKLLMQAEGKTMEDIKALLPGAQKSTSSADSVIQAFGDLLEKTNRPSSEGGYHHLRIFSGTQPVPAGEEQFDHWLEQAWLMVEKSEYMVKEKKCHVMESLKGPALEIAKYLEALESAFGTAESGDDLYFVVQRGGLPHANMDRARLEQLLRGAVAADLMLIQLCLRERKTEPPTFLQLLSEIRTEEEYEASGRKLSAFVHPVQPKHTTDLKQAEIQSLKAELKEFKTIVTSVAISSAETQKECSDSIFPADTHVGELCTLQKQVKRLQIQLNKKMTPVDSSANPTTVAAVEVSPTVVSSPTRISRLVEKQFCYWCGENGHFANKCNNQENQSKVIKRLIHALKPSRESQPRTKG